MISLSDRWSKLERRLLNPGLRFSSAVAARATVIDADGLNPGFVTDRGTERCVCCRRDTGVRVSTPVEQRALYLEGLGQHCPACYHDVA